MNVDLTHRRFEIFQKKLRFVLFRLFLRVKIFYLVFAPPTLENEPREKIFDDLKTRTCDILKTQNLKENIPTLIVSSLAISRENGFNNARQLLEKYTRRSKSQPAGCHPHVTPGEAPLARKQEKKRVDFCEKNRGRDFCADNVTFFYDSPFDEDGVPNRKNKPQCRRKDSPKPVRAAAKRKFPSKIHAGFAMNFGGGLSKPFFLANKGASLGVTCG